jgi:hypothetical protein
MKALHMAFEDDLTAHKPCESIKPSINFGMRAIKSGWSCFRYFSRTRAIFWITSDRFLGSGHTCGLYYLDSTMAIITQRYYYL